MFGFLTPAALLGLGLLAIPVILHILKPRKVRQTPFSSLRWLRASRHRMSRRIRWHQVLLLAIRVSFLSALVLALAKPVVSSSRAGQWTDRFIILDVSRSMGYQSEGEPVPLDLGKRIAQDLIADVRPGDRTAVLCVGARARSQGPMVADASVYLTGLKACGVEPGGSDLADVLRLIHPLRGPDAPQAAIDLCFITDNGAHKWSQGDIRRFLDATDAQVRVHVFDVGPKTMQNVWIADCRLIERQAPRHRSVRVQLGAVGQEAHRRTVRLMGLPGLPDQQREAQVEPGGLQQLYFELPPEYELSGKVARISIEPPDGLPSDDTYWLNLDSTAATRVLIIEPEVTQVAELQPGFHLRAALEALSDSAQGALQVVRQPPTAVLRDEIQRADAIVMVEAPALSDGDLRTLEERVRSGAGLALFAGPSVDAEFYNTRLQDPLRPRESLLPVRLGELIRERGAERGFSRIARVDVAHPLLRGLLDPLYGDLDQVRFSSYFQLEPVPAVQDVRTLAYIGDAEPAAVERPFGAGRVLFINTTASDAWSDLPRRKSFVPFVDRLTQYLAGGVWRGTFTVGSAVTVPLPAVGDRASATVRTPRGRRLVPAVEKLAGRSVIRLNDLTETGVYEVTCEGDGTQRRFPFVLLPGVQDSSLVRISENTLRSWWAPAAVRIVRAEPGSRGLRGTETRWLLDLWLVALACAVLAAEMFFVHWLCPKVNPTVASGSVVTQRGFFRARDTV